MLDLRRILAAGALAVILGGPATADTISYADAVNVLMAACGKDVEAHCKDVRLGSGRIEACLDKHGSPQCTATFTQVLAQIEARAQAQAAVPQLCKADAERLCANFREGRGRILGCLIRRDNVRKVSKRCNEAINEAGWR